MKRFYTYFIMTAALLVGATSCSDAPFEMGDDTQTPVVTPTQGYEFTVTADVNESSRASFTGTGLTSMTWDADDALGMFVHNAAATGEEKHVANNVKMSYVGENQFTGTLPVNPENRPEGSDWRLFAYFPYNSAAGELNKYDATSWTINHASRQTQIDANHSNYDKYAFFSTVDNIAWENGKSAPSLMLQDRTAALRFLVTPGDDLADDVKAQLALECIEEVDVYVVDALPENLAELSSADGVTPLSGHFKFSHQTGSYRAVKNETVNYVEVDLYSPSTRQDEFKINITADNSTYVWAVVPPFYLDEGQYLVAEVNTASYKIVYTYTNAAGFDFTANNLFNFKKVKATAANTFKNVPVVHTNDYIMGASTSADGTRYPMNVTLTGGVDLPIVGDLSEHHLKYYIRYGYCGSTSGCSHNGLEVPYNDDVESTVTWAHEIESLGLNTAADTVKYYAVQNVIEGSDVYRVNFSKIVGTVYAPNTNPDTPSEVEYAGLEKDAEILKALFTGGDPVFQAYAVCQETGKVYYGHVVHVDLEPEVQNVVADLQYFSFDQFQIKVNVDSGYYVNWNWDSTIGGNTASSLRVYRREIPAQYINEDLSLNVSLETAIAGVEGVQLESINQNQNAYYRYNSWYNGDNSFIVMLWKGTQSLQGGPNPAADHDDPYGAYCCVYQAYDASTHQLFWVRTSYFRLRNLAEKTN